MATYIKPNAIKDASIEGIKIKDGTISSSKIDGTVASKSYVDALEARATNAVQITYTELKSLRDTGKLVAGTQYRITDYTCTTSQANTRSAGHQFDIIVTADDASTLNEVARAVKHEGDTYFANSDLNAWKVWYCLDNDINRFDWTDTTNGKGVIYRMIDEFNNDIPYDFKNIIYIVKPYFIYNQWGYNYQFNRDSAIDMNIDGTQYYGYITESSPSAWSDNKCWIKEDTPTTTSTLYENNGSTINYGGSIKTVKLDNYETYTFGGDVDLSKTGDCYGNIILAYSNSGILRLNNNTFSSGCYNNTFGNNCRYNSFKSGCYNNTFGNNCSYNSFENDCGGNSFGNICSYNSFGRGYNMNSFGNSCCFNSFGGQCNNNSLENNCNSNSFGDVFYTNSFGSDCNYNSIGNYCYRNSFGNGCEGNSLGEECCQNSLGNYCNHIKFASSSSDTTKYNYYQQNHFGEGCQYIVFTGAGTASNAQQVQNYNFAQGLQGTSSAYLTIDGKRNRSYETYVSRDTDGTIKESVIGNCVDLTSRQTITGTKIFDGPVTRVKRLRFRTQYNEDEARDSEITFMAPIEGDDCNICDIGGEDAGYRARLFISAAGVHNYSPIHEFEAVPFGYLSYNYAKLHEENTFTKNIIINASNPYEGGYPLSLIHI